MLPFSTCSVKVLKVMPLVVCCSPEYHRKTTSRSNSRRSQNATPRPVRLGRDPPGPEDDFLSRWGFFDIEVLSGRTDTKPGPGLFARMPAPPTNDDGNRLSGRRQDARPLRLDEIRYPEDTGVVLDHQ